MSATFWIDVREQDEFDSGHVKEAIHIPYTEIAEKIAEVTTDYAAEIHLYCRSGRRSGVAKDVLNALGYLNATNDGGLEDIKHLM